MLVTGIQYKQVSPEGDAIHVKRLPVGTWLGVPKLEVGRSKKIFGLDVDIFIPEL